MMEWLWRTWLARDEYRLFDDDARWRVALRAARRKVSNHWAFWLFCLFAITVVLQHTFRFGLRLSAAGPVAKRLAPLVGLASGIVLVFMAMGGISFACRGIVRRHLRAALWSDGSRFCTRCGYNLRGQVVPRCPECGQSLETSAADLERPALPWRVLSWLWARVLARPEYACFAGRSDWLPVLKRAQADALNHWTVWLVCGAMILIYCSGLCQLALVFALTPWLPLVWVMAIAQLVPALLTVAWIVLIVRGRVRRALRSVLDRPAQ
jgi:hypothetical protein